MSQNALLQIGLYALVLLALTRPVGIWMTRAMQAGTDGYIAPLRRLERPLFRLLGIDPVRETGWKEYAVALLAFNLLGALCLYALLRWQQALPLNPQQMAGVAPDLAFNTAISFVTNTNWQAYGGETAMSYLSQMLGLTVQNFLSAATGIAVAFALIRGFARHSAASIGNFWVDMLRGTLYILLPGALVLAVLLMGQGVIQNFDGYKAVETLEINRFEQKVGDAVELAEQPSQTLAMGPVASQEAIKMLGTNGGGFFNANSAHPFENPTPFSNFLQMLAIFLLPAGLCYSFGMVVGDRRQGWAIFAAMATIFLAFAVTATWAEQAGNPLFDRLGLDQQASALQAGGNMEGKETRFGIVASSLFVTITTAASCGAVNAMHDALTPIGGLVPMWLMQLGEVVFGGVGSGLYGMLVYAVIAVFLSGLMIGRTPEYLGKKIEAFEIKMSSVVILVTPLLVLVGTALAVSTETGRAGLFNPGAHGFSEVLYALSSAANNNGSAFGGLGANTPFYNSLLAFAMFFGRFLTIVAVLAIAGQLASKKRAEAGVGTMPTHGPLFVVLLIGAVLLVGALTYIPALALGPVIEQLQMLRVK